MDNLSNMLWIETHKAIRSRMPLWTGLGSLFMPLGIAFLIFVSKNPEVSHRLGLVSAKADLVAYAATDWSTYLGMFSQLIAAGGFILFILIISWTFGREFADGTLKDMLAVPVQRASILLAKFIVIAVWSAVLTIIILIAGLIMGVMVGLPGGSIEVIFSRQCNVDGHRRYGDCGCLAVCAFCQPGARLPAACRVGNPDADGDQPGDDHWLGRILPLGGARFIRAGKKPSDSS